MKIPHIFLITTILALPLFAVELNVDREAKNQVKFVSNAPVESFEGVTENIDGYVLWEGEKLTQNSEIYFEADLASLDTGIGLRNRHMRENYLETDRYPYATFMGHVVKADMGEDSTIVKPKGSMTIHGVSRDIEVKGVVAVQDDLYNLQARFNVALSDYNIKIPKLMFLKIDENMKIIININMKKVN